MARMTIARSRRWIAAIGALGLALAAGTASAGLRLETVLPPLPVEGNASVFATPLAYANGAVYTVNVEPGATKVPMHGLGLYTVVRRGVRDSAGHWRWQSHVLDRHTARDPYHTEGSIALDKRGYVHVAYDMHYWPWQYSVSARPNSIDAFIFRGQRVSPAARAAVEHDDIAFPGFGSAAIPGNQITYPAFFTDRQGTLYVTYQYAVRPKRSWYHRVFAGAIARYSVNDRAWRQIGGKVIVGRADAALALGMGSAVTKPFAMAPGWWVYQIRLAFDRHNGMHVAWLWRPGNGGPDVGRPSYAYSPAGSDRFFRSDGRAYTLPIGPKAAERIAPETLTPLAPKGFYTPSRISIAPAGNPVVTLQPIGAGRYGVRLGDDGNWQAPQPLPYGAWQIRFDNRGREWAFASGLTVLQRRVDPDGRPRSAWRVVFKGKADNGGNLCHPRVVAGSKPNVFFIHANVLKNGQCQGDRVSIVRLVETDAH